MSNELSTTANQGTGGALANAVASREIAEIQGAMTMAKRFPRNESEALDKIIAACKRKGLAEVAQYQYARGGKDIVGPSIRMAETLARCWGNVHSGIRELETTATHTVVESYAIDLETNNRNSKIFTVKHERQTKNGAYALTDNRDIYELIANNGSRRLRACILSVIPGDIIDAAIAQCDATMNASTDPLVKRIEMVIAKFAEIGVTTAMLEARIQRNVTAMTSQHITTLGKVYVAIKDGITSVAKEFQSTQESTGNRSEPLA